LLVDLDYQNSLSGLALKPQLRKDIAERDQVVRRLIEMSEPTGSDVLKLMQRIEDKNGFILATDELLTSVEMQVMARWITEGTKDDVRYRLRKALHSEEVQSKFDLILIDCPPRITTTCVNALACCDYVLIPALLDSISTEAVPRLLRWLRLFKRESQICPHMKILGVVGNRARNSQGMSSKQFDLWAGLAGECLTAWGDSVHLFQTAIPENVGFADAANNNCFAANSDKLRPVFLDLFSELQQRIPFHAGQGSPAVSR
jgi:cellulose biosynthesis protein BcsQ